MTRLVATVAVVVVMVLVAPTAQAVEIMTNFVSAYAFTQPKDDGSDTGIFRIDITVAVFDSDSNVYLAGILGDNEVVVYKNGLPMATPGVSRLCIPSDSRAEDLGFWFHLPEGEERRFTLLTALTPPTTNFYSMWLHQLNWSTTPGIGPGNNTPLGSEFQTPYIALRAIPEPATLALLAPTALLLRRRRH